MNRPDPKNIHILYAQNNINISNHDIVIFLAGPTPQYGGNDPAIYSWRDDFANDLDFQLENQSGINLRPTMKKSNSIEKNIILVSPEPSSRNWNGMNNDQIAWEHKWLERANIIIFWHETRWKPNMQTLKNCYHGKEIANIGIQFRFEVGLYINNTNKIRIFYIPKHAEGVAGVLWWISNKRDENLFGYSNYNHVIIKTVKMIKNML